MRRVLALPFLFSVFACSAEEACSDAKALALAKQFFTEHREFYYKETPALREVVSTTFFRTLQSHYRCAEKYGICHLDYEPWLGAQDGDIAGSVSYSFSSNGDGKANVTLSYLFEIDPDRPKKTQRVVLRLESIAPPRCWVVSDLITPTGDSVAKRYRGKP